MFGFANLGTHRPATCLPDDCFCEFIHVTGLRQPMNTWSNLCFVLVGAWVLSSRRDGLPTAFRLIYGAAVIAIGVSSATFHATLEFLPQWLDNVSMFAYAALVGAFHTGVQRQQAPMISLLLGLGVFGAAAALAWWLPALRRYLFDAILLWAAVSAAVVARGVWKDVPRRLLLAAVGVLAVAALLWTLDSTGVLCDPHSLLQGHALWHALCALATLLVFRYYQRAFARNQLEPRAST